MPAALKSRIQDWVHRKEQVLPYGFSMTVVLAIDATTALLGGIAAVQRPFSEWPVVLIAMVVAFTPWMVFFIFDVQNVSKYEGPALWAAWMLGTAILLFATPKAITGDFAPLLLSLTVGMIRPTVGTVLLIRRRPA